MVDYIVAGAGYRGILAAALLRKKGYQVAMVDAADHVGGVLYGGHWKGFSLDLGCHLFDNTNAEHTSLLKEIFGDLMAPIEVKYAGRTARQWHENFTVPSLVNAPVDQAQLLHDLVVARATTGTNPVTTYQHYLIDRFGLTAASVLIDACKKKVQYDPAQLDPVAHRVVLFDRVNMFEHQVSMFLKQQPALDEVVAAYSAQDPLYFYPEAKQAYASRNFYPKGGTNQFCERAKQYLEEQGVQLYLNTKIVQLNGNAVVLENGKELSCQKIFWTLELEKAERLVFGHSELEKYIHPVPMVLVYFEVPYQEISDYTYLHDHSDDTATLRCSSVGKYSQQQIDGKSYICCEIPTKQESAYWQAPDIFIEQFWQEAKLLKVVSAESRYTDYKILKAPVTFKLPKIGFSATEKLVRQKLAEYTALTLTDSSYFSTQDIAKVIHAELEGL